MPGPENIDKDINSTAIVDNINDSTPDPEVSGPPAEELDKTPEPPRSDREGMSEASDILKSMGEKIETLENAVSGLVALVTKNSDESASGGKRERKPWTHYGRRERE